MSINETLIGKYCNWLQEESDFKTYEDWSEITLPFHDRHNDYVHIYLRDSGDGGFLLSDVGETIGGLRDEGCAIDSAGRKQHIAFIARSYGISIDGDQLQVHAEQENFAVKMQFLIQAILAINDLYFVTRPKFRKTFQDDVGGWLKFSDIHFSKKELIGESGMVHKFDFYIEEFNKKYTRIISTINNPTKKKTCDVIFACLDTGISRLKNTTAYAAINDNNHPVPNSVINALTRYEIRPFLWSEREQMQNDLVA